MDIAERTLQLKADFDAVYESGKKTRDKEWWSTYLAPMRNGNPSNYAFAGPSWNGNTFYPTEDIVPKENASNMFNRFSWNASGISRIDLDKRLKDCGVVLDISNVSAVQAMFSYAFITRVPILNCNSTRYTSLTDLFNNAKYLVTIDEIIIRNDGTNTFSDAFTGCTALKNVKFTGVIGRSISFSDCPLSVESLKSIITCLKDYTGGSEYSYTLTLKSSAFSALDAEGATAEYNGVACTWAELIDNKKWNLTLA